jgi:hypothetical protein
VSRHPRFAGRALSLAAGALAALSSNPAATRVMAMAVAVAVSALSLVVLMAVLGCGARRYAALTVLRVVLGDGRRIKHPWSSSRAVHRSIVVVDVEGFGDARRANWHQVVIRDSLYLAMEKAFDHAEIPWADCDHEDRGDGIFVLVPAEVPKELISESLPAALVAELDRHNGTHEAPEQIRLRMAVHAGEVRYDSHGTTAAAVNLAFRLLDAPALKAALASSPGVLAVITSSWFFDEVVRHNPASDATAYRRVRVAVKETTAIGWIHLPDHSHSPGHATVDPRSPPAMNTQTPCPASKGWSVGQLTCPTQS